MQVLIIGDLKNYIWSYLDNNDTTVCNNVCKMFFVRKRYPFNRFDIHLCVKYNNKSLIKWAMNNGRYLDKNVTNYTINIGNLKLLKWLISKGAPYNDEFTLKIIARRGHLYILKYFNKIDSGFISYNQYYILIKSIDYKQENILEWMISNYPSSCDELLCKYMDENRHDRLEYFIENPLGHAYYVEFVD